VGCSGQSGASSWSGSRRASVQGGLVFKAHRLVYHSALDLSVIKKKRKVQGGEWEPVGCFGRSGASSWSGSRRASWHPPALAPPPTESGQVDFRRKWTG